MKFLAGVARGCTDLKQERAVSKLLGGLEFDSTLMHLLGAFIVIAQPKPIEEKRKEYP
jgi:hypothetical protein|tara:strand:+ start:234 stop:407 length:174 start_codon:yes stop_codon:yes gene_type:complete